MKHRDDPHERDNGGPLFAPRLSTLFSPSDPDTSRKAAVKAVQSGTVEGDAAILLNLIRKRPGETLAYYGARATELNRSGDDFKWRLKLGRRTGTLKDKGLIHASGERDGLSCWFPGPDPNKEVR